MKRYLIVAAALLFAVPAFAGDITGEAEARACRDGGPVMLCHRDALFLAMHRLLQTFVPLCEDPAQRDAAIHEEQ